MLGAGALHDPEGWYGEGGGRGVQDGEHVYTRGRFMLISGCCSRMTRTLANFLSFENQNSGSESPRTPEKRKGTGFNQSPVSTLGG